MKNIILDTEKHSPQLTGNKAANLHKLKSAGFSVPSWITILPSALGDDARWQDHLLETELSDSLAKPHFQNALLAVRSSALEEDGNATSFAGQLDSFLNVSHEWVMTAIRSVWLSGSSERLSAYLAGMKISKSNAGTAVIVQKMVKAKLSGVAFSADPISSDRKVVVINAVEGLADKLVSGEISGDLIYVSNETSIMRKEKTIAANISDSIILEVAAAARAIETLFGCPQDIEWAHDGNQLFILQARPITTLKEECGSLRIWDNSNISESYQGVTTPLTFSFAAKAYEHVYIHFCKLMGVSEERIQANRQIFPSMLGYVRGRIYYNLVNWYRLLALLPGFQVNRPFMEQMMGVKEELPAEIIEQVLKENSVGRLQAQANFLVSISAMLVRFANIKGEINKFQKHFDSTISEVPNDLSKLTVDELAKLYRTLEKKLLSSWDAPLVNDFFAMIFFGLLGSLSKKWFPETSFSYHELLVHSGGIISAEPPQLIERMAQIARADAGLRDALKHGNLEEIEIEIEANEQFKLSFQTYLNKFGDRCFNELKLESRSLIDNPLPLLRNIGFLACKEQRSKSAESSEVSNSSKMQIAKLPLLKKMVFNFVSCQAIERIRWRENLRFERTRLFGLVRRIFLEFGARLSCAGVLAARDDIFYLEVEEVLNFVEGKSTTNNLAALVDLRKLDSKEFKATAAPPNRIVSRQAVLTFDELASPPTEERREKTIFAHDAQVIHGLGCSPGIVRGRVRVVKDPSTAKPLEDEILIAERTDPGWIVLFTQAKGIIVEYGSLLSHTAIVSRELGIPAIVSCSGVMNWLEDGDLIEFNGKTGAVRKLEEKRNAITEEEISLSGSEHDLSDNVVKLIESTGLRQEAS